MVVAAACQAAAAAPFYSEFGDCSIQVRCVLGPGHSGRAYSIRVQNELGKKVGADDKETIRMAMKETLLDDKETIETDLKEARESMEDYLNAEELGLPLVSHSHLAPVNSLVANTCRGLSYRDSVRGDHWLP